MLCIDGGPTDFSYFLNVDFKSIHFSSVRYWFPKFVTSPNRRNVFKGPYYFILNEGYLFLYMLN